MAVNASTKLLSLTTSPASALLFPALRSVQCSQFLLLEVVRFYLPSPLTSVYHEKVFKSDLRIHVNEGLSTKL